MYILYVLGWVVTGVLTAGGWVLFYRTLPKSDCVSPVLRKVNNTVWFVNLVLALALGPLGALTFAPIALVFLLVVRRRPR